MIYVSNQFSNNVSVIDGATNTVTATIAVGSLPIFTDVTVDPNTDRIYVCNGGSGTVTVIHG
jgi:YVTN family beta-propeller protein